jgi:hypothetical protein
VVDRILSQTLLPGLSAAVLDKMAAGEEFEKVQISVTSDGTFEYAFDF